MSNDELTLESLQAAKLRKRRKKMLSAPSVSFHPVTLYEHVRSLSYVSLRLDENTVTFERMNATTFHIVERILHGGIPLFFASLKGAKQTTDEYIAEPIVTIGKTVSEAKCHELVLASIAVGWRIVRMFER